MSVAIVGGNECMSRQYKDLCSSYNCKARVFPKMSGELKHFGCPDLLVLFTDTVSHKVVKCVMNEVKNKPVKIARSHSSSIAALKTILEEHII